MKPPDEQISLLERIYWWFKEHWGIAALLYAAPPLIISLVKLLGNRVGLIDSAGAVTPSGFVIIIISAALITFFSVLKEFADHKLHDRMIGGQQLLDSILKSVNTIKSRKRKRFERYVLENHRRAPRNPFGEITQPERQLQEICLEMQKVFSDLFKIPATQIGTSIVCRLAGDDDWMVVGQENTGSHEHILSLVNNTGSVMSRVLNGGTSRVFEPDKSKALALNQYVLGEQDAANECRGSIMCIKLRIAGNSTDFVLGVLSISTYGKQLYEEGDKNTEAKIEIKILPSYLERIKLELALMYIKHKMAE